MNNYHIIMALLIFILFFSYFFAKKFSMMKKIFIAIVILTNFIYIGVRFTSIPVNCGIPSFIVGLALFIAEALGLFAFCVYTFIFTGKLNQQKKTLRDLNGNIPTVDILICTYNEELSLLSKTIIAAQKLDYPKDKFKVYVLDDGNRLSLKNMCDEYNVNYIARQKNINAKAGNINNALKYINGKLFAVLDADMICKKNFLKHTVGYFEDENLAFVQTPQTYYNKDIYQYNISEKFNNEQDFFMRYIENARDTKGAVLHVGTNAVFRRKFVDKVGGYPVDSITEDMALGLNLQSEGYNSIFVNECLVCGLSASTYPDLVKQRDRWCRGNLQVLKHYKKTSFKKLNWKQKLIYLDGVLYWFTGLIKLTYIITPIIYLLTGIVIVNLPPVFLLPLFLLAFIGQILISKLILPKKISSHYFSFFMKGEFYHTIIAPHLSFSVLKHFFFSDSKFTVTSKDVYSFKGHFYFKLAFVHILLLILSMLSIIIGTLNFEKTISYQPYFINLFWILYNLAGLILSIKIAYQPPRQFANEGISIKNVTNLKINLSNESISADIIEVSEKYLKIKLNSTLQKLLYNGQIINVTVNDINYDCVVKKVKSNIAKLGYKSHLSYSQLSHIMDLILANLSPYKNNMQP